MKILVADDSPDDRLLAIRELRRAFPGAACIEVDSAEAFEAALGEPFDLLVSDYSMGWMDGLEALRAVKARHPDVPVIMLTGTGGEEVAVEAMHEGVDDYLLKRERDYVRLPFAARRSLDRAAARMEARRAQARYRDLFRSVPVGLGTCRADGELTEANEALLGLLGPAPDGGARRLTDAITGEPERAWEEAKGGGAPEIRLRGSNGSTVWAVLRVRAMEEDGEVRFECALTDVTALRHAQEERTALLGELYHRVNNNLQMLLAFVAMLSYQTEDPTIRQGLDDLGKRIHSVALVQQRLYRSGDFARVNLREFVEELVASLLQGSGVALASELADVVVPVSRAVPVGLIANELVINALKHAFPKAEAPALTVRLSNAPGGVAVLVIEDNGIGADPVAQAAVRGYGTRLIRSLARQAEATLETRSEPGRGTRVVLSFPVS